MPKARIIPILLFAVTACSDAADTTPEPEPARQDAPTPDTAPSGVPASPTAACGVNSGTLLSGDGVGRPGMGASLADVRADCTILTDTTALGAEGMRERRIAVGLGRDTVEAVVAPQP